MAGFIPLGLTYRRGTKLCTNKLGEPEMSKVHDRLQGSGKLTKVHGVEKFLVRKDKDEMVLNKAKELVGRYRIAIPWKLCCQTIISWP